jgi:xylulokinase
MLDAHLPLHAQLTSEAFSLPNTPVAQDTSAHTHALALEAALGGPDHMAARVGTCAHPSLPAAQLLRVREAWPNVWVATGRVQVASSFMQSLITSAFAGMAEAEAVATGMWVHGQGYGQGRWDDDVLDIVGGSRDEGRRVKGWLGEVETNGGGRRAGVVSRYMMDRYGFEQGLHVAASNDIAVLMVSLDTIVTSFTSDFLSSYLSLCPSSSDAVLAFGPMDLMMAPAVNYRPTRLYSLYPHPAQDTGEKRRYVATLASRYASFARSLTQPNNAIRNADVPRALVRDMYTKSWSAFDRLVSIVPPGGSIGYVE